jgi:hypothetical protein
MLPYDHIQIKLIWRAPNATATLETTVHADESGFDIRSG